MASSALSRPALSKPNEYKAVEEQPPVPDHDDAPDGGRAAWLAVAGGACIFFTCLGFGSSIGIFQDYYSRHQLKDESPDKIAWIGSISMFIQFFGGGIGGPLFDRYGSWVIRPAAVVYVAAVMLVSVCREYWHFVLTQGVLMGLSIAFLQMPAFASVSQYFAKKRATALGIIVSGSSIGGIVFPIIFSNLLYNTNVGFAWSVRIVGFIIIPFMVFAVLTVKPRVPSRRTTFFIGSAFGNKKYDLLILTSFLAFTSMFTPLFYITIYGVTKGMNTSMASYLLAIINASSTFGRIVPGVLADKYGRLNVLAAGCLSTGIVLLCWTAAHNAAGLVIYAIAIGFTSGTIISGATAAFSTCTENPQNLGTYMGMGLGLASIAALIGPPISGHLMDTYGFLAMSLFSGFVCLSAGAVVIFTKAISDQGILSNA